MIWIIAALLGVDIYTLTGAAASAVTVLVVGVLLGTAVERLTASRSEEAMTMAVAVMAGVALVVVVSSVWAIANLEPTSGPDSDGPPPLEAVVAEAELYRAALAESDLEAFSHAVGPRLMLGMTLAEVFEVERSCLDWDAAVVSIAPHGISPFLAEVTFSAEDRVLVRTFQYLAGRWAVTADARC